MYNALELRRQNVKAKDKKGQQVGTHSKNKLKIRSWEELSNQCVHYPN